LNDGLSASPNATALAAMMLRSEHGFIRWIDNSSIFRNTNTFADPRRLAKSASWD
jgi:hypothetical protein